ncbi:MAG: FxsA family protein [Devosia sp.]
MGPALLLFIVLLPLVEIALFILVGQAIGLVPTLLLVIAAAIGGAVLLRWQGLSVVSRMRMTMSQGQLPARAIADTMLIGIAGMLLFLPGFFTDILALLLLVPAVRTALYRFMGARMKVVVANPGAYATTSYRTDAPQRLQDEGTIDLDDENWRRH